MKHGVYTITFLGKPMYEVYVWIGQRQLGYIGAFRNKTKAIEFFNENK